MDLIYVLDFRMSGVLEPQVKRIRIEAAPYLSVESCSRQISQLRQTVTEKLTSLESDVKNVANACSQIASRLEGIEASVRVQKQSCCEEVLKLLRDLKHDMGGLAAGAITAP